jgi:TetR/AcrR family transcriptional regulator
MQPAFVPDAISQPGGVMLAAVQRKRPKRGERRQQILQTLLQMLEGPAAERITTAALAGRLGVSEAALYRHFASKGQMFEALIDFIESSVFDLIDQLAEREPAGPARAAHIVAMVLQFGEKNPGMARVMMGDALVLEHERLRQRMNQLFDKIETALRQSLVDVPTGKSTSEADMQATAAVLTSFMTGRLQRFARSAFHRAPTELLDDCLARIL